MRRHASPLTAILVLGSAACAHQAAAPGPREAQGTPDPLAPRRLQAGGTSYVEAGAGPAWGLG